MKQFLLHIINNNKHKVLGGTLGSLVLLIFSIATVTVNAQIISPLDGARSLEAQTGPENRVIAGCTDADSINVYVAYQLSSKKITSELYRSEYAIAFWNGLVWNYLPSFIIMTPDNESSVKSMIFYENELYVAGNFVSAENIANGAYLIKWDGQNWVEAADFTEKTKGTVKSLAIYDNKLIVGGIFEQVSGVFATNLAQFNGTDWDFVGNNGIKQGVSSKGEVKTLKVLNNELYVGGNFSSAGGNFSISALAKWDGTDWASANLALDECFLLGEYKGQLIAFGSLNFEPTLHKLDEGNWVNITDPDFRIKSALTSFANHNGQLWASGSYIDNTDGGARRSLLSYDGIKWTMVQTDNLGSDMPLFNYPILTKTKLGLFVSGGFNQNKGVLLKYIGKIENNISIIQGTVFNDLEANCIKDNGEPGMEGRFVVAQPGDYIAVTDELGHYVIKVPQGNYTLKLVDKKYWITICPSAKDGIEINVNSDSVITVADIPSYGLDYMRDLNVTVSGFSGWKMREGYTEKYLVCAENIGTYNLSGAEITLKVDERLTNVVFKNEPYKFDDYTATWKVDLLKADQKRCYEFTAVAPIEVINGETVTFSAHSNYLQKDEDLTNNSYVLTQTVTSAYDPNNKQVRDPKQPNEVYGEDILIAPGTDLIEYQINFQNTGNDTAYKVTVVDTISIDHTFKVIDLQGTSHNSVSKFRLDKNIFIWTFEGIMLPDSTTDLEGSKGYINFKVSLRPGIAEGKTIHNKAYIYFDYQKPIETNEIRAKVSEHISVPPAPKFTDLVRVYPNPAASSVTLENQTKQDQTITITDVTGKVVGMVMVKAEQTIMVNTTNYAAGIYFIRTQGSVAHKLVIQH